ncbi:MAG: DUF2934 domain-containing protein [Sulfuricella sp.]
MATTPSTAKKTTSSSAAKTTASAKTTVKKPVAAKVAAPKKAVVAAPKKPAAKRATVAKSTVTPEQRYCMVAEAAYFHAERHGFLGNSLQDWIAAEAEIAALLSKK